MIDYYKKYLKYKKKYLQTKKSILTGGMQQGHNNEQWGYTIDELQAAALNVGEGTPQQWDTFRKFLNMIIDPANNMFTTQDNSIRFFTTKHINETFKIIEVKLGDDNKQKVWGDCQHDLSHSNILINGDTEGWREAITQRLRQLSTEDNEKNVFIDTILRQQQQVYLVPLNRTIDNSLGIIEPTLDSLKGQVEGELTVLGDHGSAHNFFTKNSNRSIRINPLSTFDQNQVLDTYEIINEPSLTHIGHKNIKHVRYVEPYQHESFENGYDIIFAEYFC